MSNLVSFAFLFSFSSPFKWIPVRIMQKDRCTKRVIVEYLEKDKSSFVVFIEILIDKSVREF